MLHCPDFYAALAAHGFTYFCGVPDSTFKEWLSFLETAPAESLTHRRVAIERDAIGYAAGYFLATGRPGVVYLQNSGLGNTVNPLTSLTDELIYRLPLLLMVGWRGEPGRKDEPQHSRMGQITWPLLELLGIRAILLPTELEEATLAIAEAQRYLQTTGRALALVVREGTFAAYQPAAAPPPPAGLMTREAALTQIADRLGAAPLIVATTGKTARELFEYRAAQGQGHQNDFLMVGAMGLASAVAAEVALQRTQETVVIFDGDAAALMSAGNFSAIGLAAPPNLYHVIFDNGCHESTGGQASTASVVAWEKLAQANAYRGWAVVNTPAALAAQLVRWPPGPGPFLLVVKVRPGSRSDLGRPTTSPLENRMAFMTRLRG